MRTRFATVLVLIIALCGFIPTNGYSSDNKYTRESLKGIKGVYVLVETLETNEISDGLTGDVILNDVELRLRQNGIKVFSKEEYITVPGSPVLYISTNFLKLNDINHYSYSITVEFQQGVTLSRNKYSLHAPTWNYSIVGIIPAKRLNDTREGIKGIIDRFINAYLSVNPKK